MRNLRTSLVVAVLCACVHLAGAQTSDNLLHLSTTGGSLTIGDKVFNNFSFQASGLTNFNPANISVTVSIQGGVYYLTYAGNINLTSGGPASADLVLNYNVTATQGQVEMIDQYYAGSAQAANGGSAFLAVDEVVRDSQGNVVANSHLDANDLSDPFGEPGDNLNVNPPQSFLRVTKDISFGVTNGGFVTISEVAQSFHQVPEPGTAVLVSMGLVACAARVLRRKRS